jgi:hypothetical protein
MREHDVLFIGLGLGVAPALLFGAANLVEGFGVRALTAMMIGRPVTGPLRAGLVNSRGLLELRATSVWASVLSGPLVVTALWISTGQWSWATLVSWSVRNSCGTFVIVALVLTIVGAAGSRGRRGAGPR